MPKYGSRTVKSVSEEVLRGAVNLEALMRIQGAVLSDFVNEETSRETRQEVTEAINETIIPAAELVIKHRAANGLNLIDLLGGETSEKVPLEKKLTAHLDAALYGETKMNVPAVKVLMGAVQQQAQAKETAFAAALLNDPEVQTLLAKKMLEIKGENE